MTALPGDVLQLLCGSYLNYSTAFMLSLTCKFLRSLDISPARRLEKIMSSIYLADKQKGYPKPCSGSPSCLDEIIYDCSSEQLDYIFEHRVTIPREYGETTCLSSILSDRPYTLSKVFVHYRFSQGIGEEEARWNQTELVVVDFDEEYEVFLEKDYESEETRVLTPEQKKVCYYWRFLLPMYALAVGKTNSLLWCTKQYFGLSLDYSMVDLAFAMDNPKGIKFFHNLFKRKYKHREALGDFRIYIWEAILEFDSINCYKAFKHISREGYSDDVLMCECLESGCTKVLEELTSKLHLL